jgi:4'-phosphopantetheinyl transferase EntD
MNCDTAELSARLTELARAAHSALLTGCRAIAPGDEFALTKSEMAPIANSVVSVRRASGSARIVARALLSQLGSPLVEVPRSGSGAPSWPPKFVGSISHDSEVAVVAVAAASELASVGIDVEPAQPLAPELFDLVARPSEQTELRGDLLAARQLFCIKEAVFKACHPLDGQFFRSPRRGGAVQPVACDNLHGSHPYRPYERAIQNIGPYCRVKLWTLTVVVTRFQSAGSIIASCTNMVMKPHGGPE